MWMGNDAPSDLRRFEPLALFQWGLGAEAHEKKIWQASGQNLRRFAVWK